MANELSRPHLGRGWAFPVRPTAGALRYVSEELDIEQAVGIILETTRRERVMEPAFGSALRERVFDSNSTELERRVEREVAEALRTWEPRIDVERVSAHAAVAQPNVLMIEVDYVVRRTNSAFNLVFPFYLAEGV